MVGEEGTHRKAGKARFYEESDTGGKTPHRLGVQEEVGGRRGGSEEGLLGECKRGSPEDTKTGGSKGSGQQQVRTNALLE